MWTESSYSGSGDAHDQVVDKGIVSGFGLGFGDGAGTRRDNEALGPRTPVCNSEQEFHAHELTCLDKPAGNRHAGFWTRRTTPAVPDWLPLPGNEGEVDPGGGVEVDCTEEDSNAADEVQQRLSVYCTELFDDCKSDAACVVDYRLWLNPDCRPSVAEAAADNAWDLLKCYTEAAEGFNTDGIVADGVTENEEDRLYRPWNMAGVVQPCQKQVGCKMSLGTCIREIDGSYPCDPGPPEDGYFGWPRGGGWGGGWADGTAGKGGFDTAGQLKVHQQGGGLFGGKGGITTDGGYGEGDAHDERAVCGNPGDCSTRPVKAHVSQFNSHQCFYRVVVLRATVSNHARSSRVRCRVQHMNPRWVAAHADVLVCPHTTDDVVSF